LPRFVSFVCPTSKDADGPARPIDIGVTDIANDAEGIVDEDVLDLDEDDDENNLGIDTDVSDALSFSLIESLPVLRLHARN